MGTCPMCSQSPKKPTVPQANGVRRKHRRRPSETERRDSGLCMRPASDSKELQMELLKLTSEEVVTLYESFEAIKRQHDNISAEIYKRLRRVPGAREKMDAANRKSWQSLPHATILLSGIERCLLRLKDEHLLKEFILKAVHAHVNEHDVPKDMMLAGLDIACEVVLKYVGQAHSPPPPRDSESEKHIWQNCEHCSTWARFFELLHVTLNTVVVERVPVDDKEAPADAKTDQPPDAACQ